MGEHIKVDAAGLLTHAGVCDSAAAAIPAPAPAPAGHASQATTMAVAQGHALVELTAAALSGRASTLGGTLREVADAYTATDEGSAGVIGTVEA